MAVDTRRISAAPLPSAPRSSERDVRWELAAALRHFGQLGYEFGANGHISARAETAGQYWVGPYGVSLAKIEPDDFVLVDRRGEIVESIRGREPFGFSGNLLLHEGVADAAVVIHLHTPRGFIWSSLGHPLRPINTDSALIVRLHGLSDRLLGGDAQNSSVGLASAGYRIIQERGHGFVTWGSSVGEAAFYLWASERAADANLVLLGIADALEISSEHIDRWTLDPDRARSHFEPVFMRYEAERLAAATSSPGGGK